jgi:hypothetical protein
MLEVREVLAEGHAGFTQAHLDYVRDMANRSGFTILGRPVGKAAIATIRLNVAMTNPVFKARIEEGSAS